MTLVSYCTLTSCITVELIFILRVFLGDLLLVNVENKDIAYSKKTESKITSLVWVQQEKAQKKDTIDSVLIKVIKFLPLPFYLFLIFFITIMYLY